MYTDANEIIDFAKKSPQALKIFNSLKSFLEDEKEKRKKFYETVKEDQKAEFINGEVIIHSPVKRKHNQITINLGFLIEAHINKFGLGEMGYDKIMIQLTRNDYEPDICFFNKSKAEKFTDDQMLFPPPDFVVEVLSPSTEKNDRTVKLIDYEAHGIREYWIIDPEKEIIEQYILEDKGYFLNQKSGTGQIKSVAVQDFEIPVRAVFDKEINNKAKEQILK